MTDEPDRLTELEARVGRLAFQVERLASVVGQLNMHAYLANPDVPKNPELTPYEIEPEYRGIRNRITAIRTALEDWK